MYFSKLKKEDILILGAGQVQPRKGVDIFISVANNINKAISNKSVRFLWIGDGYEPSYDFMVSLWLQDQIVRSGLSEKLLIIKNTSAYKQLINRADLFLMTSRLDPLPNVAIDAMYAGTPMLCFEKLVICGLSEKDEVLKQNLVAQYLDINNMSKKAIHLINNDKIIESKYLPTNIFGWFNIDGYAKELDRIGYSS